MMHSIKPGGQGTKKARRGTSVTELALVLPVVLMFVLGAIDFAQVMYAYGTVSEAARAGARFAIAHGSAASLTTGPTANDSNVAAVVKYYAFALNQSNLTVTSTWGQGLNSSGSPVTVTATYTCYLSVGKLIGISSINVNGSTTMLIAH
jgi:Flp pilus assembly protein TadG